MKKLIGLTTSIIIVVSLLFGSCQKNVLQDKNEFTTVQKELTSEETISYTIPKKLLVKELEALMIGREKGNITYDKAQIKYLATLNQYEITVLIGDFVPTAIVCSGNGYSFASCVDDWFGQNPLGCLVITYNSDADEYSADDDC